MTEHDLHTGGGVEPTGSVVNVDVARTMNMSRAELLGIFLAFGLAVIVFISQEQWHWAEGTGLAMVMIGLFWPSLDPQLARLMHAITHPRV